MTKWEKLIERMKSSPRDVREAECVKLLEREGFSERKSGAGSQRIFTHPNGQVVAWHSPHGGRNTMDIKAVKYILQVLGYWEPAE